MRRATSTRATTTMTTVKTTSKPRMRTFRPLSEEWLDMSHPFLWLPEVLKKAGLKVAEVPGWERRGRPRVGPTRGVICHHTAGGRNGNMPSLNLLINGRPGRHGREPLPGPLSQLGLG